MKKSCLEKEVKLVTSNNVSVLNDSDVKKKLWEDPNVINRKLLESGIQDEKLSWIEKKNILKTINVSLSLVGSEIKQNTSATLATVNLPAAAKWIDNSFEISKNKDDVILSTKQYQGDVDEFTSLKSDNHFSYKNYKKELTGNNCLSNFGESPKKLAKKVHYIKIQVEGTSKEECNILLESGKNKETISGKKRTSPLNKDSDLSKRPKMEQLENNEVDSQDNNVLKLELELQNKRKSIPFKRRDIKTIVAECEFRNKKWKETFSKYNSPAHWGIPIVKNCIHKWDGKQIPQKLLHRYQKYLLSKKLYHPLYLPINFENNNDLQVPKSELLSQSNSNSNETQSEGVGVDSIQNMITRVEENKNKILDLDSFNPSTSHENESGRMVLRNRNQHKSVVIDDEFSSGPDDLEEWQNKQKSVKKVKNNSKIKRSGNLNNQQLILKLEKCSINKNLEVKNVDSFTSTSSIMGDSKNQIYKSKALPDPDTMVCPICSLRFKKQLIESHATECASKTYKD